MEHRQRRRRVEIVIERRREAFPAGLVFLRRRERERVPQRVPTRRGLRHRPLVEVDRLAPRRRQEEDEHRLASPLVERLADRRHVAGRLRHLLAGEPQHPVVRPDRGERMPQRARLRDLYGLQGERLKDVIGMFRLVARPARG